MKALSIIIIPFIALSAYAQDRLANKELSVNGFRNPSIGLEFRYHRFSIHSGYYPSNFQSRVTTSFIKTGLTYWYLPIGKKDKPSSFYSSLSWARGLDRDYQNKNAVVVESGFRWMMWKGLNLRLGVAALMAAGENLRVNPTPGISYSFFWK